MKDSGVEWLGEIPSHWRMLRIRDIGEVVTGTTPPTDNAEYYGGEFMFISPADLSGSKSILSSQKRLSKSGIEVARTLPKDSVLVSCIGIIGKVGLSTEDVSAFNQQINAVICKPGFDSSFLYYLTTSNAEFISQNASQTIIPILNKRDFGNITVCLPPLAEQRAIASYLDRETAKIDRLINKTQALNALLSEKRVALISRAVTKGLDAGVEMKESGVEWLGEIPSHWDLLPIKAFTRRKRAKNRPDLQLLSVYRDFGVIPKDSRDDNHNRASLDLSAYQVVDVGDLAINKMKTWQGSLAVSRFHGIVSPAYIICELYGNVHPRFVHHLLRSSKYITQYASRSYGVRPAQWDMRYHDFREIVALIPPLHEQRAIASYLDRETARIDALINKNDELIALLREKRSALISAAVTGKISVDLTPPPGPLPEASGRGSTTRQNRISSPQCIGGTEGGLTGGNHAS